MIDSLLMSDDGGWKEFEVGSWGDFKYPPRAVSPTQKRDTVLEMEFLFLNIAHDYRQCLCRGTINLAVPQLQAYRRDSQRGKA